MSIYFVKRKGGAIVYAGKTIQPGEAEEQLDDQVSSELQTFLAGVTAVPDQSQADNLDRKLKAVLLACAALSGKTPAQARAAFKTAWDSLA